MKIKGTIVGLVGSVAEVEFLDRVPALHTTLSVPEAGDVVMVVVASASSITMHCVILTPLAQVARGMTATDTSEPFSIPVGKEVLGRAFDVFGMGHDGKGALPSKRRRSLYAPISTDITDIVAPTNIIETGIKAIDFFAPMLHGGKAGMIGGAGIGKTVILTELINRLVIQKKATKDRVAVFSAVGERSREAQELYDNFKEGKVLPYTSLVMGEMGENPAVRFHTALAGAAIAEDFREQLKKDVLFFMDNIFRFGQAGLELSTLMNTIPSEDGYQPTLQSEMGDLMQRLTSTNQGSITSFMALYVPSDDITESGVRSVFPYLDTVVVLSREIFQAGRFPAIDLLQAESVALSPDTAGKDHYDTYIRTKKLLEQTARLERIVSLVGTAELSQENQNIYARAKLIENFMTQDLFISEAEMGHTAEFVPRLETVETVRDILDGVYDHVEPDDFKYIGSVKKLKIQKKTPATSSASTSSGQKEESQNAPA